MTKRIDLAKAPSRKGTLYPPPYDKPCLERVRTRLGDAAGLTQFGVNLLRLPPGAASSQRHWHASQDEFVYVLEGEPTLVTETAEVKLSPGMCAGFPAAGEAHQLVNRTNADVLYLEVGDRTPGDEGSYPKDDIQAVLGADGRWVFTHKDGRPY